MESNKKLVLTITDSYGMQFGLVGLSGGAFLLNDGVDFKAIKMFTLDDPIITGLSTLSENFDEYFSLLTERLKLLNYLPIKQLFISRDVVFEIAKIEQNV